MTTSILGVATRKIEAIQAWLRSTDIVASERQGAQEIADLLPLWKAAGEEFGVRWDISVGQLIEESGWFGFKNDVREAQCNPTGIGATGGGVVGDSFPDWKTGFRAHFQNMALRGRRVPVITVDQVIAPYVKKNYSTISTRVTAAGKPTTDWEDLTGTYAMNPNYHNNIFSLVAKMDKWIAQNKPEPEPTEVTWHNAHILIDEKTRQMEIGLASYAGDKLRSLGRFSVDSGLLSAYLSKFPNAKNIVKAEPTKAWPGAVPVDPVDPVEPFVEIKVGDSGERVEGLQEQINRAFTDITLVTDGKFGPATEDAVKKFCTKAGIAVLGIVNEACWKALIATKSESLTWEKVTPGQKLLTIPWATRVADFKTSWTYDKGYPSGLIVHFTATGPSAAQEKGVEDYMRKNWSVFMMKRDGTLLQTFPLNRGGYHCGTVHHDTCLGVEIVAAGRCTKVTLDGKTKYAPWYAYADDGNGSYLKYPSYCFDESEMRYSGPNKVKNIYSGMYQKYTQAQEDNLIKLCLWLKEQAPDIFSFDKVLGHDEACPFLTTHSRGSSPWLVTICCNAEAN
jgi:N-acetyl-anhydromuramyl-L-alanine amidase AmpD